MSDTSLIGFTLTSLTLTIVDVRLDLMGCNTDEGDDPKNEE